ncbi:hypothetical protein DL764_007244 [Monosporascus ibericus]|uniref:Fucose-specific lectin n=1 Tax=Monosporascus ibericus TaxID=155417 RepID=A0A4Q4T2D7_9PEZI|nr:hypothetical protein DL764_007244 [Monosporascus ibericus]
MARHPQGGYDYSTLEVHDQGLPEPVNVNANCYPETTHGGTYKVVNADDSYTTQAVPVVTEPRICGLRKKTFWIVLGAGVLIIVAVVVGVVAGVLAPKSGSDGSDESEDSTEATTSNTTLYNNTRLASANFTDEQGNSNYLVVYQLASRAVYLSAWNSSHREWIVSPIIDGTTDVSLDDVQAGTGLGLDVYWHGGSARDVHLYWQAPNGALRTVLYRGNLTTDRPVEPARWEDPYSIQNRYTAAAGSALASYGLQCYYCTPWTYFFWQGSEGAIHGAWRTIESSDGWGDITFTQNVNRPVANSSLAVTNVPSINGTATIDIFYQSQSGVLTHIIFDGDEGYSAVSLPRGNLGTQASIVAFATGYNDTDTPFPLGFQVLTVGRDSDTGVHLTYYKDGSWTAGDDVAALSDCVARATLAANSDRRIYCVVDGDGGVPEIVEWSWAADPIGNLAEFVNYDRVGVVGTL